MKFPPLAFIAIPIGLLVSSNVIAGDKVAQEPQACAKLYSNDLSVTSKQHYYPIRFRKINNVKVYRHGYGDLGTPTSGLIYLEPGKHQLEVYIKDKNLRGINKPSAVDRQYINVNVKADTTYELVAYEKQGEERTLQRGQRFKIEVLREKSESCDGGKIYKAPEQIASK